MDADLLALQEVRDCLRRARAAADVLEDWNQEQTDRVVRAMAEAGRRHVEELARLAVEDSGFGRLESKIVKNTFCTEHLWNYVKDVKTAGIVRRDEARKVYEIASPMGIVAAIIPITNPTSTALFKCIISIKARNAVVVSPHPRGVRCIGRACEVLYDAAIRAGAPEGCISWLRQPTLESTQELMRHRLTSVILATGGPGLVKQAYSSGKPAIGVGPGNCPAWIDRSADVRHAVRCLVLSQTFDWGTICASEQSVVLDRPIAEKAIEEFVRQGAHVCTPEENRKIAALVVDPVQRRVNPAIVGLAPHRIAQMAGFAIPESTSVLLCPETGVGWEHPLSIEKLSPILSLYVEDGWKAGCKRCMELLAFGGEGHTIVIHATDQNVILEFGIKKQASRILVNSPSSQGSVGFATNLVPSMTLGCGTPGCNIVSDNINAQHLVNIKRIAYHREDFPMDGPTYHAEGMKSWERPAFASFEAPRYSGRLPDWVPSPVPMGGGSPRATGGGPPAAGPRAPLGGEMGTLSPDDIQRIISQALGGTV